MPVYFRREKNFNTLEEIRQYYDILAQENHVYDKQEH